MKKIEYGVPILVSGILTREKLDRIRTEVSTACVSGDRFTFIIESDGGATDACLELVELLEQTLYGEQMTAKIYSASSGAALIALTCFRRIIAVNGSFGLHVGSIELEAGDISGDGKIPERHKKLLDASRGKLYEFLRTRTAICAEDMATLDAKGTLVLNAAGCLKNGICEEFF